VDNADVFLSLASDVVVVMALLFGHGDGEKASVKDPGVGDASAKAAPISRYGGLNQDCMQSLSLIMGVEFPYRSVVVHRW
jgi:hypothetical protein